MGRIGRSGEDSISISLVFPQKGHLAPEAVLRSIFRGNCCLREAMNGLFQLSDPLVDYTEPTALVSCERATCELVRVCQCSKCCCCSYCNSQCCCPFSVSSPNEVMEKILGFGDNSQGCTQDFLVGEEVLREILSRDTYMHHRRRRRSFGSF